MSFPHDFNKEHQNNHPVKWNSQQPHVQDDATFYRSSEIDVSQVNSTSLGSAFEFRIGQFCCVFFFCLIRIINSSPSPFSPPSPPPRQQYSLAVKRCKAKSYKPKRREMPVQKPSIRCGRTTLNGKLGYTRFSRHFSYISATPRPEFHWKMG